MFINFQLHTLDPPPPTLYFHFLSFFLSLSLSLSLVVLVYCHSYPFLIYMYVCIYGFIYHLVIIGQASACASMSPTLKLGPANTFAIHVFFYALPSVAFVQFYANFIQISLPDSSLYLCPSHPLHIFKHELFVHLYLPSHSLPLCVLIPKQLILQSPSSINWYTLNACPPIFSPFSTASSSPIEGLSPPVLLSTIPPVW